MNDQTEKVVFFLGFAILGAVSFWWHMKRSLDLLHLWVRENNLTLVKSERRILDGGPFTGRTGRGQEIFYVTVKDKTDHERNAYGRCNSLSVIPILPFWSVAEKRQNRMA
jgi:hypothetical protein